MQWGRIDNYFTEAELECFHEDIFMPKLCNTFDKRLTLQTWDNTISRQPILRHADTHCNGIPNYMQFLVPNQVDGDNTLCHLTSTVIEGDEIQWKRGSLLWWYSKNHHWSGNMNKSRRCWVIQTRVS
tara:strand:+ start:10452 stop:10832 length:381 start_codon:yes stop_codon:yes gene_type:complete